MKIEIDVSDEISPMVQRMLEHNPSYMRHVSKSLGWWFQKNTKTGVKRGAPGGVPFKERIPLRVRKAVGASAASSWYGRMKNAIGYSYDGKGTVSIGWTSATAAAYGKIQEYGFERNVTSSMRAHWAAAGYPLSIGKKFLSVPARPIFEPMARELRPQIGSYVENKLQSYIKENVTFGKKNRRIYKVYG